MDDLTAYRPNVGVVLFLYGTTHSFVYGVLDQVRTDAVLPAPYPARP